MSWLSSLFGGGGNKKYERWQAQQQANEAKAAAARQEALILEQMEMQKEFQLDLAVESAMIAAKEGEFRSRYRREGIFHEGSFQEYGRQGGFLQGNVARPAQESGVRRDAGPSYVFQAMAARPSETPGGFWDDLIKKQKEQTFATPGHTAEDIARAGNWFNNFNQNNWG